MQQAYVVTNGIVTNTVMLEDDANPADFGATAGPQEAAVGWSFDGANWAAPPEPAPSFEDLRKTKLDDITTFGDTLLSAGARVTNGLHVALDDSSRQDMTAMGTTALAAASGSIPWPDSYSRGWITIENVRIPLATPAAGLTLAASVGNYYAAVVQHRRDLKDQALAAVDAAALDAIDISAGWPT